jgi:hypothetical protein
MTGRVLAALPLLIVVVGCVNEPRSQLVNSTGFTQTSMPRSAPPVQRDPKNEAMERRVLAVSGKIIETNPQAGMRPWFITFGAPHLEIFHRGGGTQPWQVFISAQLAQQCKTDAQLAAVLCLELGKMVAERESLAGAPAQRGDLRLPPEPTVGQSNASFGSPDSTRYMEQARLESTQGPGKSRPLPSPDNLARGYLFKAGYDIRALAEVAPLLRQAEDNYKMEKQMRAVDEKQQSAAVEIGRPVISRPTTTTTQ